jgi:L-2-hydroxyglutarate oxidase
MKRFCQEQAIPYEECGKLVVATTPEEVPGLRQLHERGVANGVERLRMLDRDEFRELEPHCEGICALHVPATGIVNYVEVAKKYAELIEQAGGKIVFPAKVIGLRDDGDANVVETTIGAICASYVINCAGLYSDTITRMAGCKTNLEIIPFRGEYYEVKPERRYLVKNPIYPVPDPRFPKDIRVARLTCLRRSLRSAIRASGRWRASTGRWEWPSSIAPGSNLPSLARCSRWFPS